MYLFGKLKSLLSNNKTVVSNFSYMAALEVFVILAPLIAYPYLVRVLGMELYGWVITAQVTSSYALILIDFGFRRVSAKYVAKSRDDIVEMSRVVSTIVVMRLVLWAVTFVLYMGVVVAVPAFRSQWLLFLLSYGMTFSTALLPDFYFQGIEKMKYVTLVNLITRSFFLGATFVLITRPDQYLYVPVLWTLGYVLGGGYSFYVIFHQHKIIFIKPRLRDYKMHLKETTPIFFSDVMQQVKDKLNYNLLGGILGMNDVVIYDLGYKITQLLTKPTYLFCCAIFPRMSREPNVATTKKIMASLFMASLIFCAVTYMFLPLIVKVFIGKEIDLFPLQLYLLVPLFTGVGIYIPSSVFIAFGKNKYVLYTTIFSCFGYIAMLAIMWLCGWLTTLTQVILLTVLSNFFETLYRVILASRVFKEYG